MKNDSWDNEMRNWVASGTFIMMIGLWVFMIIGKNNKPKDDFHCLGVVEVTATNPAVKNYKKEWYQLKEGECSVSQDLQDVIMREIKNKQDVVIQEGDTIKVGKYGIYKVKSFMGKYDNNKKEVKRTIDIYKPTIKDCKVFGRRKSRVWVNY